MNSLLDRLFRLRLAASLHADDKTLRERRLAELRELLDEIALPVGDGVRGNDERGEREWLRTSAASRQKQAVRISA